MSVELRPHQINVINLLRDGIKNGHRAQILYLPAGGGKTECAIELMRATVSKGNRAAMVLDRVVLCNQTSQRLDKYNMEHGVLQAGHWRYRPYERIQVCSAQTLEKRGSFPDLSVLIIDECHTTRRQTVEFIKNNPQVRVIGLTASPFTNGLGSIYTNVACSITVGELVEQGWLAPLRVFISKEIDMTGAKKVAGEWNEKVVTERGVQITGDIVSEWISKTNSIFGGPKKTIVFCAGVAHGADLAQKFNEAGYNFIPISYMDTDEFKRQVIEDFSKPDTAIHGLIATDILTKGFDVPDTMIGISARPFSKSFSSHVQQMGRIMRAFHGKEFGVWLDHSGNFLRFQSDWEDLYQNGVKELKDGKEKPRSEPTPKEKKESKCPVCSHLWPKGADTCPSCGFVRAKRSEVVAVPGEMHEIAPVGKVKVKQYDMATKDVWYGMLLQHARSTGKKDGWAYYMYKEKFGVGPAKKPSQLWEPTPEVLGFIKHAQIKFANRKNRHA